MKKGFTGNEKPGITRTVVLMSIFIINTSKSLFLGQQITVKHQKYIHVISLMSCHTIFFLDMSHLISSLHD